MTKIKAMEEEIQERFRLIHFNAKNKYSMF